MKTYEDKKFYRYGHYNTISSKLFNKTIRRSQLRDKKFLSCTFDVCSIVNTRIPYRTEINNIILQDCEFIGVNIYGPIIRNLLIDNLKTNRLIRIVGAAYERVTLRGIIGKIMITPFIGHDLKTTKRKVKFDKANEEFYSKIDWALDIREAEFSDCAIRGIPSKLVRLNPVSQVVIKREKVHAIDWKRLDLSGTYWKEAIESFSLSAEEELILVAPKGDPLFNYEKLLVGIEKMKEIGLVENI